MPKNFRSPIDIIQFKDLIYAIQGFKITNLRPDELGKINLNQCNSDEIGCQSLVDPILTLSTVEQQLTSNFILYFLTASFMEVDKLIFSILEEICRLQHTIVRLVET